MSEAVQIAAVDWGSLGTGIAIAFIAFMQVWQQHKAKLRDAKLDEVHKLVNSAMSEQLFIGMIAAESLSAANPTETNHNLAVEARRKYEDHLKRQANVDTLTKT